MARTRQFSYILYLSIDNATVNTKYIKWIVILMTQTRKLIKPIWHIKQSCKYNSLKKEIRINIYLQNNRYLINNILNIFHKKVGISISLITKQKIARIIDQFNHKYDKFDEFERSELYDSGGWIYTIVRAIEHRSMENTIFHVPSRLDSFESQTLIVHGIYSLYQLRHRNRDNAPPVQCHRIFTTATGRRLSEEKSSVTTCRPTRVSSSRANREFQPLSMNL